MTEQEWLQVADPQRMLEFLHGKASDRKYRLFAVACCRRIWHLMTEDDRHAVEVAEQFSEGLTTAKERDTARYAQSQARPGRLPAPSRAAGAATFGSGWSAACCVAAHAAETGTDGQTQCDLIREILGNPFRPITLDPSWLIWHDGLLVSMAKKMYDSRNFSDMPVLADALEEAGCTNPDILEHCRGLETHVRGCWVVDLLLGKE